MKNKKIIIGIVIAIVIAIVVVAVVLSCNKEEGTNNKSGSNTSTEIQTTEQKANNTEGGMTLIEGDAEAGEENTLDVSDLFGDNDSKNEDGTNKSDNKTDNETSKKESKDDNSNETLENAKDSDDSQWGQLY